MKCQNCGSPKEKHESYDTSKNLTAPVVTDSELLKQANAGPNWECEYCRGSVRNLYGECENCGGPKTTRADKHESERMSGSSAVDYRTAPQHNQLERQPKLAKSVSGKFKTNKKPLVIGTLVVLSVASLIGLAVYLFMPHNEHVVVRSTSWIYLAHLQQRRTVSDTGWDEEMPSGAFDVSCTTRQRGTENCHPHDCNPHSVSYDCRPHDCNCHTTCSDEGNGYSSCSESCSTCYDTCERTEYDTCYDRCPVYDDWCSYSYYEWPTIRTERLAGNDHEMREPVLEIDSMAPNPQRIVRVHQFSVVFANRDNETWSYEPNGASDYNRFERGVNWLIEVNHAGSVNPLHVETDSN